MYRYEIAQAYYDTRHQSVHASGSAVLSDRLLGGSSGNDAGHAIALDSTGNAYIAGIAISATFPVTHSLRSTNQNGEAFVTKLVWNGSALSYGYSTYLGGSGYEQANGIAVDSTGTAYVTGETDSADFPTVNAVQATQPGLADAFVTKLLWNGTSLSYGYSTYLGGDVDVGSSGYDYGYAIAVDAAGYASVTGKVGSFDFPLADPIQPRHGDGTNCDECRDVFVATLPPEGIPLRFGTYLGNDRSEEGYGIAVDAQRNIYITGYTTSARFPTTPGGADPTYNGTTSAGDVFAAKISQPNRVITYSYDGLQRLAEAVETPGLTYNYSYDNAGNRTGVWINGTRTITLTHDAANQVSGWSYDNAGNLLSDGATQYSYDALNRTTMVTNTAVSALRTNTYNGDGVLLKQRSNGTTTHYVQDLAAPLSQVLQVTQYQTTTSYLYGLERLAAKNHVDRQWYLADALGSVRRAFDNQGTPEGLVFYDPWGMVESGALPRLVFYHPEEPVISIDNVPAFGFTGELHDAASGLVNLRARWYSQGERI